jgi:isopentenyl diphosphate isomerase/L-lactate dehydrogenase-like FMN-dependent dehydrogenase
MINQILRTSMRQQNTSVLSYPLPLPLHSEIVAPESSRNTVSLRREETIEWRQISEPFITLATIPGVDIITSGPVVIKAVPLPDDYDARIDAFFRFLDELETDEQEQDGVLSDAADERSES